jgi:hypothetical protein
MPDLIQYILIVLVGALILGALGKYAFLKARSKKRLENLKDPYWMEGENGNFSNYTLDRTMLMRAFGGFKVQCRVKGWFDKVSKDEFRVALMLEPGAIDRLADDFMQQVVRKAFEQCAVIFDWGSLSYPVRAQLFTRTEEEGVPVLAIDLNNCRIAERINEIVEGTKWRKGGCTAVVTVVDLDLWDGTLIKENTDMLTDEDVAAAKLDPKYLLAEQNAMVLAMKRYHDAQAALRLGQREQSHLSDGLTIRTSGMGCDQSIAWEKRGEFQGSDWEVLGFRETGGFSDDPLSEATSGSRTRLVHSQSGKGESIDRVDEQRSYFYTFFVKNRKTGIKISWVRFSVITIGEAEQLAEIKAATQFKEVLARLDGKRPEGPIDPRLEKWKSDKAFLGAKMKMRAELTILKRAAIDETRNSMEFKHCSTTEQKDWLDWLDREFETREDEIFGLA